MWNEIAAWQEILTQRPDLSVKTMALYTQDARRFATWLQQEHPGLKVTEVTPTDAKMYRDHMLAKRYAPTTINRALIILKPLEHTYCKVKDIDALLLFKRLGIKKK
jgi:site-specific recombinase XerD